MKRKYLDNLIAWKKDPERKPLLVLGARQVGKSYLIEELFAKEFYKGKYLRIDCSDDPAFVDYVFANDSLQKVIDYIQVKYNFPLDKDHLLIIDEAQECLPIMKMMKHFCEKRRDIPLIVSGSLVRIKIQRQTRKKGGYAKNNFLFPVGKINQLTIFPLTFDEFLLNYKESAYEYLLSHYRSKEEIDYLLHDELLEIFNEYLFVGGMPEVVQTFLTHKDEAEVYSKVVEKLKEIYTDYLSDMELYQASPESVVRSKIIFQNVFSQLNGENKNFKASQLSEKLRSRDLLSPLAWLQTAKVINKASILKEKVTAPLVENDESVFRVYLADMGMFTFQSGLNARNFVLDKANAFSGIYYENYVSVELVSRDFPLFYWKGKRNSELEFLIDVNSRIVPLDAKKWRGSLSSLGEFRNHNKTDVAIKVSTNRYGFDRQTQILTVPFYYLPFVLDDIRENNELSI